MARKVQCFRSFARRRIIGEADQLSAAEGMKTVSVFEDQRVALEHHEFMMGKERGRLAVSLDLLTDALVLVGQHGVYCPSARNPSAPALDIQAVLAQINGAKELVGSVMERLKQSEA